MVILLKTLQKHPKLTMNLRPEIEPNLDIAEKHYPEILNQILKYTEFVDKNGDENNIEYKNLETRLNKLTNKDISKYNLWEYWEEEGAEILAFRIGLPDPLKVDKITKEEVTEIVRRIGYFEEPEKEWNDLTFKEQFSLYFDDYYHAFLKLNFKAYDYRKIFGPQKDKNKKEFWLTDEQKVELIWER